MRTTSCRDCGGIVSKRAKACPRCGAPVKQESSSAVGLLVFLVVGGVFWWYAASELSRPKRPRSDAGQTTGSGGQASGQPPARKSGLNIGAVGILRVDQKGSKVPVATSQEALDRLTKLSVANDSMGMAQMALAGQVLLVPDGTRAKLIDPGFLSHEVRVLEGDFAGRSGFIAAEFLVAPPDGAP